MYPYDIFMLSRMRVWMKYTLIEFMLYEGEYEAIVSVEALIFEED